MKDNRLLTNFQKKKTAEWLLNISQASVVGGIGSLFFPEIGKKIGYLGTTVSVFLSLILYFLAMLVSKEVKNNE